MSESQNTRTIAGVEVTAFTSIEKAIKLVINEGAVVPGFAIAINAEKILSSLRESGVRKALELATLRYPDGFPIVWTLKKKGVDSIRVPGCDLWLELMKRSSQLQIPVYILGSSSRVNTLTVSKLKNELNVNVVGANDGFFEDEELLISNIIKTKPKIVTVAMGSPKQELLMARCREAYPDAFYMGVGGTYDVYVGNNQRAPLWMQNLNLEWLYRLIQEPSRFKRQMFTFKYFFLHYMNKL